MGMKMETPILRPPLGIYLNHPDAKMPTRAYEHDVGYDLYAIEDMIVPIGGVREVSTGIHIVTPPGIFPQINARSSFGKQGIIIHHGVMDPGYTGEISVWIMNVAQTLTEHIFKAAGNNSISTDFIIKKGDKIGQLLFHKAEYVDIEQISELPKTERGDKGHGSSGR